MLETPQLSPLGVTKGTARNAGDDNRVNMVKNDHNNEVHGDRSGLGERKDLLPFPNWPFTPPIPAYLLPPPIPQLPFAPPFQIPPIPSVPSWPQFPFPPLQMPPFPFVYPSPPA
ncbi:hypothetical protein ACJRO7_020771 [Eucalyptus globulus]|uniref:Uncharacterized protein n=1 Tax=Eucalyptus globulus TaxID=34317 RepID=A0ABD3KPA5_EUCGL